MIRFNVWVKAIYCGAINNNIFIKNIFSKLELHNLQAGNFLNVKSFVSYLLFTSYKSNRYILWYTCCSFLLVYN